MLKNLDFFNSYFPLVGALVPSTRHSVVSRFLPFLQAPLLVGLNLFLPYNTLLYIGYKDSDFSTEIIMFC